MPFLTNAFAPQPVVSPMAPPAGPKGLKTPGTLANLAERPVLHNADGSVSTERSISIGTKDGEVLIPTVVGGKQLSKADAIKHYRESGEHLGVFDTPENADAYAISLHNKQDARTRLGEQF